MAQFLVSATHMLPRPVLPGQFYMVTRRCTQRQFLLRPDAETNEAFTYCLIEAAQRSRIEVILPCAMSNHHHTVIYDRWGRYPEFVEHFHKMLARCQNALRGRCENFWSSEQVSIVRLADRDAVMDKLVYVASNPVKDYLVDRVHHWPGVNGLSALVNRRPLRARRPYHFFRKHGSMPAFVEMQLTVPPELGPEAEVLAELRDRVQAVEADCEAERRRTGRRVCGRRNVLEQSWHARPNTREPRGGMKPLLATRSKWTRLEALMRNRIFTDAYMDARTRWRAGEQAIFPPGTYWLRRFAHVAVAEAHAPQPS